MADDFSATTSTAKVTFTATASDTFYNAAGAYKSNLGTCEAQVPDNTPDHYLNG